MVAESPDAHYNLFLTDSLANNGSYTCFYPDNEGWLRKGVTDTADLRQFTAPVLFKFLISSTIYGQHLSSEFDPAFTAYISFYTADRFMPGEFRDAYPMYLNQSGGEWIIRDYNFATGKILKKDIQATNGIIHEINFVMKNTY